MEIFLYKSICSNININDFTLIFQMYIYSQQTYISVFFFISSDFLFPHCPTSFLCELLNPVKFLWSGFRALIRKWITLTKHVLLIIYYMYILGKKYLVMQYSYIYYMIYMIFVSASVADTDHAGLVTICRADADPYRTPFGTPMIFSASLII